MHRQEGQILAGWAGLGLCVGTAGSTGSACCILPRTSFQFPSRHDAGLSTHLQQRGEVGLVRNQQLGRRGAVLQRREAANVWYCWRKLLAASRCTVPHAGRAQQQPHLGDVHRLAVVVQHLAEGQAARRQPSGCAQQGVEALQR